MKKVIYSPEVGKPKMLKGDEGLLSIEKKLTSVSSGVSYDEKNDEHDFIELNALADLLKEENKQLNQELSLLKKELEEFKQDISNERVRAQEQGYKDAMLASKNEIEKQVDERVALGEGVLDKVKSEVVASIYDNEGICLEIIYSAISRLIGESAGSKEQIREIARLTMEKVASVDNLDIYVSSHDYEALKDDEFASRNIIRSADIEYGGCVIKAGKGTVEAKLDDQLVKLKTILLNIHKAK